MFDELDDAITSFIADYGDEGVVWSMYPEEDYPPEDWQYGYYPIFVEE